MSKFDELSPNNKAIRLNRENYKSLISGAVGGILNEDGYISAALEQFPIIVKLVILDIITDLAAVKKFGRLDSEQQKLVTRYNPRRHVLVDPLMKTYAKTLKKAGSKDFDEYKDIFDGAAELVLTASFIDPFLRPDYLT